LGRGAVDPCFNGGPNPKGRGAYVTKGGSLLSPPRMHDDFKRGKNN
jgi:hypothetical protein